MPQATFICNLSWVSTDKYKSACPTQITEIVLQLTDNRSTFTFEIYTEGVDLLACKIVRAGLAVKDFMTMIDSNVHFIWRMIEISYMLTTGKPFSSDDILGRPFVVFGEDERQGSGMIIQPQYAEVISDWSMFGEIIKSIPVNSFQYPFYLSRVLNIRYPMEIRWLNAYKIIEEFYGGSLGKNKQWKENSKKYDADTLNLKSSPNQPTYGYIEEVRNIAAHAVCDYQITGNEIIDSFPVICKMAHEVVQIINENKGKITFQA